MGRAARRDAQRGVQDHRDRPHDNVARPGVPDRPPARRLVMPDDGFGLDIGKFIQDLRHPLPDRQPPGGGCAAGAAVRLPGQRDPLSGAPCWLPDAPTGTWIRRWACAWTRSPRSARCRVPVWAADSGGKGIQLFTVAHGRAQFAERWGEHGARTLLDTAGVLVLLPGITDPDTLDLAEKLCGQCPRPGARLRARPPAPGDGRGDDPRAARQVRADPAGRPAARDSPHADGLAGPGLSTGEVAAAWPWRRCWPPSGPNRCRGPRCQPRQSRCGCLP